MLWAEFRIEEDQIERSTRNGIEQGMQVGSSEDQGGEKMSVNPLKPFFMIGTLISRMNSDVDGYIELASNDVAKSKGKSTKDCRDYLMRHVA